MTVAIFYKIRPALSLRELGPLLKRMVLAAATRKKGAINLVLTSDAGIRRLNKSFLGRTGVTDVIAFNHSKPAFTPPGELPPFGDIFICLPQARRQAKRMGHSLTIELLTLAAHGALHLSGMDDATPALRRKMDRKTVRLLKKLL